MATISQTNRPFALTTPLGADVLGLSGFTGEEGISRLFEFRLDLFAETGTAVPFDGLLGKGMTVAMHLPEGKPRFLHGIVRAVTKGASDPPESPRQRTAYRVVLVPQLWLLQQRIDSRIFQQKSVPDILAAVLKGLDVVFELRGTYEPRDRCIQYRESDFTFASRLMEEEGIYYFFKHANGKHSMVVADTPASHPDLPVSAALRFEPVVGGLMPDDRVHEWEKSQELTSGKVTLWDHSFELPSSNLEAQTPIKPETVQVGTVSHKLKLAENEKLERYDYPGGYVRRFDGIGPGGGERAADVQKLFQDNRRTAAIRMDQEASTAIRAEGASNCRQVVSGHKLTLGNRGDADGAYVVLWAWHEASAPSADRAESRTEGLVYTNRFTCVPATLAYRPPRTTPRPRVDGCQTAVVVGGAGEEIFTDKYGRVKVQFFWDRQGQRNADSSCWVRVATSWAGRQWGAIHIPRVGQEVVVDFLEGDPDQPIIVGSVYNADNMPPYALPANKTQSGIKSRSSLQGGPANFNEFRFEDKKGSEQVYLHAERNMDTVIEANETVSVGNDRSETVGHDETISIGNDRTESVGKNETITIGENRTETVGKDETISITGKQTVTVEKDRTLTVSKNQTTQIGAARSVAVGKGDTLTVAEGRTTDVGKDDALQVGKKLVVQAGDEIVLKTGDASITLKKDGTITIKGKDITISGSGKVNVKASSDVVIKGSKVLAN